MAVSIWAKAIPLRGKRPWPRGTSCRVGDDLLELPKGAVVVIVGPNNAGKSTLLRELQRQLQAGGDDNPGFIVGRVECGYEGTDEEFKTWVNSNLEARGPDQVGADPTLWGYKHVVPETNLYSAWASGNGASGLGACGFVLADVHARVAVTDPAQSINFVTDQVTHPLHLLWKDPAAEQLVSARYREAFRSDLCVDRAGGAVVALRCGQAPTVPAEGLLSMAYLKQVNALPSLESQGDGRRSFVGCLLMVMIPTAFVVLVDEPEAFLHPPQARLLGRVLVDDKPSNRQLVIATHSGDILRGILAARPSELRVVRLQRAADSEEGPSASVLGGDKLEHLWADSILRVSNVLDGLFHEQVVVCEEDADCRFYDAVLRASVVAGALGAQLRPSASTGFQKW